MTISSLTSSESGHQTGTNDSSGTVRSEELTRSGDWISIWELAKKNWPQKPRYYASRLLNYSILHDLPRVVGDIMGAIGEDTERLYNISVNSPNVDRISKEVFLSESFIKSHIESRRFSPEERYLPRRPRQEEYLISKPASPYMFFPPGEGLPLAEEDRLNYFARMGIPYGVTRKRKIPVALDYRQNLLIDRESPQVKEIARKLYSKDSVDVPEGAEPPSVLGCINSEDALIWNVFRTLMRENGMHYFLNTPTIFPGDAAVARDERISAAWFWGMNDRGSSFLPMETASEGMKEPPELQTVPSLLLLGINQFIIVEGRYASLFSACPMLRQNECPGIGRCHFWHEDGGIPTEIRSFVERDDIPRTCGRHFQLMRLYLLLRAMTDVPSMGEGLLVAVIDENQQAGSINRKLFADFLRNIEPERHQHLVLTSWQNIKSMIPFEPKFEELHREFREKWGI